MHAQRKQESQPFYEHSTQGKCRGYNLQEEIWTVSVTRKLICSGRSNQHARTLHRQWLPCASSLSAHSSPELAKLFLHGLLPWHKGGGPASSSLPHPSCAPYHPLLRAGLAFYLASATPMTSPLFPAHPSPVRGCQKAPPKR